MHTSRTFSVYDIKEILTDCNYMSNDDVCEKWECSLRTLMRIKSGEVVGYDHEILEENIKLAKQKQRLMDDNRIKNKSFREFARIDNTILSLNDEMVKLLNYRKDKFSTIIHEDNHSKSVGVIQLSDLHFGELVNDTINNKFDIEIASKRLKKLVEKSKVYFKANNIKSVAVFMTGDLINSNRRLSEITSYASSRVNVVFNAYLILGALLEDLYSEFKVTVAYVVGNESRMGDYFDSTNLLASDNFDLMLFNMLKHTHYKENLTFIDSDNPMEQVVNVNGSNFLLVHGNGHKGLAHTSKIEVEVEKIKARYALNNVKINYVICGHIHSTYISNSFSRSASLVGSNAYSERTLNFTSKASQNIYIVNDDKSIDAIMVDLQQYDGYGMYKYDKSIVTYDVQKEQSNVVIQKVLV